jgi:hypothetical protein
METLMAAGIVGIGIVIILLSVTGRRGAEEP